MITRRKIPVIASKQERIQVKVIFILLRTILSRQSNHLIFQDQGQDRVEYK